MTSFPVSRKWGHPRWRPEAEGPPFSTSTSMGVEKRAPGPGWRHFQRRHLGSKMATPQMTSGGRRDAREDVLQTSAPSMSPVEVWLYWKHLIVSLTQALSKWLSELPTCHYGEVDQSARVNTMKRGVDSGKHLIYFFFTKHILISRMTMRAVKDPCDKRADLKIHDDLESLMEMDDDKINDTDLLCSTIERNAAFWKWAFLQQVKRAIVLPPHTVKTRGGRSRRTLVLPKI